MKTRKVVFGLLAVVAMLVVSCGFRFEGDLDSGGVQPLTRSEVLALEHLKDSHEITQGELEAKLLAFLGDSGSRNAFGASAITGVEVHGAVFEQGFARNAGGAPVNEIPFYVFNLENGAAGTKGFALAGGDSRVGDLFAVVEDGELDADHPFFQVFFANLDDYILESMEVYNKVTPDDIRAASSRQAAVERSAVEARATIRELKMETRWGQGVSSDKGITTYNDVIASVYGQRYYAGCVAVAVAQIMAYHRYPKKPEPTIVEPKNGRILASFLDPYVGKQMKFEDVEYDWTLMASKSAPSRLEGWRGIGVLMLEVASRKNLNMDYQPGESTAYSENVPRTFRNMGYRNASSLMPYDFNTIRASIDAGSPVYARGDETRTTTVTTTTTQVKTPWWNIFKKYDTVTTTTTTVSYDGGHAWVIDGYRFLPVSLLFFTHSFPMVHCNLGWNGNDNGWYYSGVFDTNRVPIPTRSTEGTRYDFQFNQQIIPHIAK